MRLAAALAALAGLLSATASLAGDGVTVETFGGREILIHRPSPAPSGGAKALVVVLHGGLGNARRIVDAQAESGLNLNAEADANGFEVAYLNGTPVTRLMGSKFLGWNAGGGCCGQPAARGVDDVAYIRGAVGFLARTDHIAPGRVYAAGHSNGAIMAQRMVCQTDVFAGVMAISGPLAPDIDACPAARGKRALAIHGAEDQNVPVTGGRGTKGLSGVDFGSEARAANVFTSAGATYDLKILPGAEHRLDTIDAALRRIDGRSIAETAVIAFGLTATAP